MSGAVRKRYKLFSWGLVGLLLLMMGEGGRARLLNITLADLAKKSDLIAYGETTGGVHSSSKVSFRPAQVLKGKGPSAGRDILLCNKPTEVESYDLRKMKAHYVVFASKKWHCYKPLHGASSIVEVSDGAALTFAIADQPPGQPFDEFMVKIRSHLK